MVGVLTEKQVDELIDKALYAHLGCQVGGKPYVVPISYARMGNDLVGHTNEGLKVRAMRENPVVCIQIDDVKGLSDWTSVILWGRFEELSGPDFVHAEQRLIDRYGPMYQENPDDELVERDAFPPRLNGKPADRIVYRINVTERSGRFERSDS
jgi:uncharacterized protein